MITNGGTRTSSSAWRNTSFPDRIGKWGEGIISLLFPPRCILCGGEVERLAPVCERCAAALPGLSGPRCVQCEEPLTDPRVDLCPACGARNRGFTVARSLGPYASGWGALVRALKFDKERAVARFLAERLAGYVRTHDPFGPIDIITYVPMTRTDRRARGFNQAQLLAHGLGKRLGVPVRRLLTKVRQTPAQAKLSARERRKNLRNAFSVVRSGEGAVLIIDDIYTTGATVEECAQVLKEGGYGPVYVLTVARA